jgi:D-3-phosphoglycerate dehydrogenase
LAIKILVCDPIEPEGVKMLRDAGYQVDEQPQIGADELKAKVSGYDGVIVRGRTKITREVMQAGNKLRVIARSGVGLDNIDLQSAKEKGVQVVSTPAAPSTSVAELAVTLMLSVLRQISYSDKAMKEGKWIKAQLIGGELKDKTVGVVGVAGRIGLTVTSIVKNGFGASVIGYDVIDVKDKADKIGFEVAEKLEDLLKKSDIITIHVPYLPSTHHLIDEKMISIMKNGAILVNTSRADIVDGKALLKALKNGRLGGVGLDVFHNEPPKEDWEKELVTMSSGLSVCTCHIGAQTREAQKLESTMVAEQMINIFGKS